MGMNEIAILKTSTGELMPLLGVSARGTLAGALLELEVEQRYRNARMTAIEAVFTFPLPKHAVLMAIQFELAGKTLTGVAAEKMEAQKAYEDAIEAGDSAILLEKTGDGLYSVSLGNLMPGEEATVRFCYAQLLNWEQGALRVTIPTAIAPRYGSAEMAGVRPPFTPTEDLLIQYPFRLEMEVKGELAAASWECPTHSLSETSSGEGRRLILENAYLDRDFVLQLEGAARSSVHVLPDGDGWTALAVFCPQLESAGDTPYPVSVRLVIDCSGSMAGDSIASARRGALSVVESLGSADEFSITVFGSSFTHLTPRLLPGSVQTLQLARHHLAGLEADMGGTEMEAALQSVSGLAAEQTTGCVLMITDGEIWQVDAMIGFARQSSLRYFVVGVGSCPAHSNLQRLAEETGGAYEAATPGEDVEQTICRQLARMRQPAAEHLKVVWPTPPDWVTALPKALFHNDTLHTFASFPQCPDGQVRLLYTMPSGTTLEERASVHPWTGNAETLARIAVAQRLADPISPETLSAHDMVDLAVKYNLVTDLTNYVVVHERAAADKAVDLPEIVAVKHMLAAGWGGTGRVTSIAYETCSMRLGSMPDRWRDRIDMSAQPHDMSFTYKLDMRLTARRGSGIPSRISTLVQLRLNIRFIQWLKALVDNGVDERNAILLLFKILDEEDLLIKLSLPSLQKVRSAVAGVSCSEVDPDSLRFLRYLCAAWGNEVIGVPRRR